MIQFYDVFDSFVFRRLTSTQGSDFSTFNPIYWELTESLTQSVVSISIEHHLFIFLGQLFFLFFILVFACLFWAQILAFLCYPGVILYKSRKYDRFVCWYFLYLFESFQFNSISPKVFVRILLFFFCTPSIQRITVNFEMFGLLY